MCIRDSGSPEQGGSFDINKLRYHQIVLMTDADVDGSHIRTLLLTFFYRQMPEILEKGYLYIAQPPLYRVWKGKKGLYMKDQAALDRFFLEQGVDGVQVRSSRGQTLSGEVLFRFAERLRHFRRVLPKIEKMADPRIIATVLRATGLGKADLKDQKKVEAMVPVIRERLQRKFPDIFPLGIAVGWNAERASATMTITPRPGSVAVTTEIDEALMDTPEYDELFNIEQDVRSIGPAPYLSLIHI